MINYFNRDIIENIVINFDIDDVISLFSTNKSIRANCNDKRMWDLFYEKNNLELSTDINNYNKFVKSFKMYKNCIIKANNIIDYAKYYNNHIFIDLNIDQNTKEKLLFFIYQNIYKKSLYDDKRIITFKYLKEIDFDFNNGFLFIFYENDDSLQYQVFSTTDERTLDTISKILYYFPTIDLKIGNNHGGHAIQNKNKITNIRFNNKTGKEPSIISKTQKPGIFESVCKFITKSFS